MRRREFIGGLSGAAIALPLAVRAQPSERIRRIGVLMNLASDDREGQSRFALFRRSLQDIGWVDGQNVKIDARWGAGNVDQYRKYAAELVALEPDIVVTATTPAVLALRQATRNVPIVFVGVIDPVGSGLVASLSRPGGNVTGFLLFEYALAAKWLDGMERLFIAHVRPVEADDHERPTIDDIGDLGCAWRVRRCRAVLDGILLRERRPDGIGSVAEE